MLSAGTRCKRREGLRLSAHQLVTRMARRAGDGIDTAMLRFHAAHEREHFSGWDTVRPRGKERLQGRGWR